MKLGTKEVIVLVLFCACLTLEFSAAGDSIIVNGKKLEDVHIIESSTLYYVNDPADGSTLVVRKDNVKSGDIEISEEAEHLRLRDLWKNNKEKLTVPLLGGPEKTTSEQEAPRAVPESLEEKQASYKMKGLLADQVVFELQYMAWSELPEQTRKGMYINYAAAVSKKADAAGTVADNMNAVISDLEDIKQEHLQKISEINLQETDKLVDTYDDFDLQWNSDMLDSTVRRRFVQDVTGQHNPYTNDTVNYYAVSTMLDAARVEAEAETVRRVHAAKRQTQVQAAQAVQSEIHFQAVSSLSQLSQLQSSISDMRGALARIITLENAYRKAYTPQLQLREIDEWEGLENQKTTVFSIQGPLWIVRYLAGEDGSGELGLSLFDADADKPVTLISSRDFMNLRYRVFKNSGHFYLNIKVKGGAPYRVQVLELNLDQ